MAALSFHFQMRKGRWKTALRKGRWKAACACLREDTA
jgi:hypothetical protein